jgi:hypothetical protein
MSGIGSAVGGITNGIIGGQAAVTAGNAVINSENQAMQVTQGNYNANSPNYKPFIQNGTEANNELGQETGQNGSLGRAFTQADFHASPSYQFDMQQGLNAINNSNSVRGGSLSGGTQKAMSNYGEQQANNGFQQAQQNFVNNQNQNYQQLTGLSQQGLAATQGLGALGAGYATSMGNEINAQGQANSDMALGKAGAFEGAVNSSMKGLSQGQTGYGGSGLQGLAGLFSS